MAFHCLLVALVALLSYDSRNISVHNKEGSIHATISATGVRASHAATHVTTIVSHAITTRTEVLQISHFRVQFGCGKVREGCEEDAISRVARGKHGVSWHKLFLATHCRCDLRASLIVQRQDLPAFLAFSLLLQCNSPSSLIFPLISLPLLSSCLMAAY